MSSSKSTGLWGSTRLPLPYIALLVLVASLPLALLLGTLPLSSRARLLLLERLFVDSTVRKKDPDMGDAVNRTLF